MFKAFQSGLTLRFSSTKAGYSLSVELEILRDESRKASSGQLVSDLTFTIVLKARNILKIQWLFLNHTNLGPAEKKREP